VISAEPQQLEVTPKPGALVVLEHRRWWQWILRWLLKKEIR
jgi:hypothetical protein